MSNPNQLNNLNYTDKRDTKSLVIISLLSAICAALSFIEIPFIAVGFLKYDASNIAALIGGLSYGVGPGVIIGVFGAVIHAVFTGNWPGCIMNIVAVCAHVIPVSIIFYKFKNFKMAILGMIIGIVIETILMTIMNVIIDPFLYGYTQEAVLQLILPVFIPFNLIKTIINSVLSLLIFKPMQTLIGNNVTKTQDTPEAEKNKND